MKRAAANDSFAIRQMGMKCYREGDYGGSFKYLSKAVELGDVGAHHFLGALYLEGKVSRRTTEKHFIATNGLLLVVIPGLDTILDLMRG